MKNIIFTFVIGLAAALFSQTLTGPQIMKKANDLMNQKSMQATMTMTIVTSSGQERTFEYNSLSKNFGEKNLMIYLKPIRVKGQKMLRTNNGDDLWYYNASNKRARKLASHAKKQKFEGSDFSYEDMGAGDAFIKDYDTRLLGEENKNGYLCYKLELVRKPESTLSYSKLLMWVIKDNFLPLVIDYYDDKSPDRVLKTLVQSDIKIIDDIPTAMKMKMENHSDNTTTSMTLIDVKYNVRLDDELFTERGLKK